MTRAVEISELGNTTFLELDSNGNVGIGTASPGGKFEVSNSSTQNLDILFSNTRTGTTVDRVRIKTVASGQGWDIENDQNQNKLKIRNSTASSDIVNIYNSASGSLLNLIGNGVGIGTDSPSSKFEVYHNNTEVARFTRSNGVPHVYFENTADSGAAVRFLGSNGYGFKIDKANTSGGNDGTNWLRGTTNGFLSVGHDSPNSALHVSSSGANAYDSTLIKGGNHAGLTVTQANNATDMVGIMFGTGGDAAGSHWSGITGSRSDHTVDWGTQLNFYTHDEDTANITYATQKMVIKGSGNVGIGTTNPAHLLEVSGTGADGTEVMHIRSSGNVADGGYHWMTTEVAYGQTTNANIVHMIGRELASKNAGYFGFHYAGDHSNDNFITLGGYAADQLLNIKMNGNVGIGTTSPNTLLDVNCSDGGNSGPGTSGMTGISVKSGFVAFRNNGSVFNEAIRGESNCTGIYNYNYNDGVLIYTNNANSNATPSFHPAYHFGGYNNADMETFGRGWSLGDPIFTMARPGSKSTGSGYGAKGISNSGQFTSIVKTATKTEFRDNQGQHYFDSNVTAGQSITAESTTAGFHYRSGNTGSGYRSFVSHDGQYIFRDTTDYNHKMWYYDGVNIGTNQSHGHFRVWGENNTSRNATEGGQTLRFSVDTPNGNIGVTEGGSQIYSGSDERLKTNVVDLPNQLDKINQLRPVSYDWKYTSDEEYIYGFIAQEVQAVDDTVVYDMGTTHYREDKQYGEDLEPDGTIENTLAIYERQLIPMMVKAMQEMSDKIDSLQQRLDDAGL